MRKDQLERFGTGGAGSGRGLIGWAENSSGQSRAVRWYYDSGWQVEELDQLEGSVRSEGLAASILGQEGNDLVVVGKSYDPDPPLATIWGILGQQGNDFTQDLNDLVISDNPPVLREATGIGVNANDMLLITANGVAGQPGLYSMSLANTPHAYILVETEVVPVLHSYREVVLLAVVLAALATVLYARRRGLGQAR